MASSLAVTKVLVEDYVFPSSVKAPGSDKPFFLGGAGERGMEIKGQFVKFTAIGVYLEETAVGVLAGKWKGKTADELAESVEFFRDVVTGPFEKFTQVTMILPLTGQQYSEKVAENSVAAWKAMGIYGDEEAKAVEEFLEVFKDETMPPGNSVLFTQSPLGSLTIGFSKHDSIPESGKAVIRNKNLSGAVLESIIGKHGVSPAAKLSLASRVSELLMSAETVPMAAKDETVAEVRVEDYVFPPAVKAPGSDKSFFLGGAGERGLEIEGRFIKFTAIGVYLEETAITALSGKWKGKTADDLADSIEFFRDIVSGPFEKFTQVTMILPLTGQQYSEKVAENSVAAWKAMGIYTDEEAKAITEFLEIFNDENLPPGNSVLFTQSPLGSLTIGFSEHHSIPKSGKAVIRNKALSEAVLESIIGKHGVSPAAKKSLAARVSELLMSADVEVKAANDVVKELERTQAVNDHGLLQRQQRVTA